MFKELKEYAKAVKEGEMEQGITVRNTSSSVKFSPENNYYKNRGKHMKIKDYIESHVHGVTVKVTGGEKILPEYGEEGYSRRPIVVRTFKNNGPYEYNEVMVDGIYMDEKDCAMLVYDNYIGFFIEGSKYITNGKVSRWEHFISRWLSDNNFADEYYYCEDNQIFKIDFDNDSCEMIVPDVAKEVIGIAETDISDIDSEYGVGLVILCRDKQILLGYDGYFVMETT